MRVWRLANRRFASLDGEGARLYGGRWNPVGRRMVYTSEHLSLALLEVIVHLELPVELFPLDYIKLEIEIPENLKVETLSSLPKSPSAMVETGRRWIDANCSVALRVPSVIVGEENNLLINPDHPDFRQIRIHRRQPFKIDRRLLAQLG